MFVCVRLRHAFIQRFSSTFLRRRAFHCQTVRRYPDTPANAKHLSELVKRWELSVSPFIKIKCNLGCSISVQSLDPHEYPEADRAFVSLLAADAHQTIREESFHLHYDHQSEELEIVAGELEGNATVELVAPIKCDLHICTKDKGNVQIQKMECDRCIVYTERGHCVLSSVKGHVVQVRSSGGNVTGLYTIHGNVDIRTSVNGNVNFKKIQGTTMNLSAEHGDVNVKTVYAESSSVSASSGKIQIGHVHGCALVQSEKGNVIIGAVSIRVPSTMKAAVHLCGTSVSISSEIAHQETERTSSNGKTTVTARLNGETLQERWIKASAENGAIDLKTQSWFETLRLGAQS
ncbi:hypothetical protein DNTS_024804 [Danionella cerebrum]|uniref:DUF4097 domain-containing protein n=1 Tax=Danionella cerebrum TaxID=2873325 RepID=A0A553R0T8_9TELE|nr:hypothetical protein DNTS_024804 [Danionella translucida]